MSDSKVVLRNGTEQSFLLTPIVFNETEIPAEKFWKPKLQDYVIGPNAKAHLGTVFQGPSIHRNANFIVSFLLTFHSADNKSSYKDVFLNLKVRLKGSKTINKLKLMASCFPLSSCKNSPHWHKGRRKVMCKC